MSRGSTHAPKLNIVCSTVFYLFIYYYYCSKESVSPDHLRVSKSPLTSVISKNGGSVDGGLEVRGPEIQEGSILHQESHHLSVILGGSQRKGRIVPIKEVGVKSLLQGLLNLGKG